MLRSDNVRPVILALISLLMVGCQQITDGSSDTKTISLRLGYFPQHMYHHSYSLVLRTYSVSGNQYQVKDSSTVGDVTPSSDDVHTTITTDKAAIYIGAYLLAQYSSYPDYYMEWKLAGNDENSNTNYFWLNYQDSINNRTSYGITDKMMVDVAYNTVYTLDFQSQPYYLFRLNSTGVSSIETVVTSLVGTVNTASMPDVSCFWLYSYGTSPIVIGTSIQSPWASYYYYVPGNYSTSSSVTLKYNNLTSGISTSSNLRMPEYVLSRSIVNVLSGLKSIELGVQKNGLSLWNQGKK